MYNPFPATLLNKEIETVPSSLRRSQREQKPVVRYGYDDPPNSSKMKKIQTIRNQNQFAN